MKLLLWIAVAIVVAVWFVRSKKTAVGNTAEGGSVAGQKSGDVETMISCAYCGVHVPVSESVAGIGLAFCSEEHRRLGSSDA